MASNLKIEVPSPLDISGVVIKQEPLASGDVPPVFPAVPTPAEKKTSEGRKYAVIAPESIKIIAESCGISPLHNDVATLIAQDISYKLNEVIHHCNTFLRQSKRSILLSSDVDQVFEDCNIPPVYGHRASLRPAPYQFVPEAGVFVPEDKIFNLYERVFQKPNIMYKKPPVLKDRWMAPTLEAPQPQPEPVPFIKKEPGLEDEASTSESTSKSKTPKIPPHLLAYFDRIASVILGHDDRLLEVVLIDLRSNPKLDSIIPCLLNMLVLGLHKFHRRRWRLLQVVRTLLRNPHIQIRIKVSLHRLISVLLMCSLEPRTAPGISLSEEYRIKTEAASVLGQVVSVWSPNDNKLKLDIIQKLGTVLYNGSSSLKSHYGSLVCLTALNNEALDFCLWPLTAQYLAFLDSKPQRADVKEIEGAILSAVEVMYRRELSAVKEPSTIPQGITALHRTLVAYFGDSLQARCPCHFVPTFEESSSAKREEKRDQDLDVECRSWTPRKRRLPQPMSTRQVLKRLRPKMEFNVRDMFELHKRRRHYSGVIQMHFAGGKPLPTRWQHRPKPSYMARPGVPSTFYKMSCELSCIGQLAVSGLPKKPCAVVVNGEDSLLLTVL